MLLALKVGFSSANGTPLLFDNDQLGIANPARDAYVVAGFSAAVHTGRIGIEEVGDMSIGLVGRVS